MANLADINALVDQLEATAQKVAAVEDESSEVSPADLDTLESRLAAIQAILDPTATQPVPAPSSPPESSPPSGSSSGPSDTPAPVAPDPGTTTTGSSPEGGLPPLMPSGS